MAAAMMLLPSVAHAQKKKPKAPAPAPATAPAAPAAPANGGEIELDQPATPPPDQAAQTGTPAATPDTGAPPTGTGGGICEIDPSACPKPEDVAKAANRAVKAEIYAVEQIYALRKNRFEVSPYWGVTLNDQFVSHPGPGLNLNFYVTNVLAVGVNGNWYDGLNSESDFNFQNRRAAHLAVPLNDYQWSADLNLTYVPIYGKFAGFNEFIFSYDAYVLGGLGAISTKPVPVIDPDNRSFTYKTKLNVDLGIGLRIFLNRWFAATLEIRDYIYNEELENTCIAGSAPTATCSAKQVAGKPTDQTTWYGQNQITNNVQAQIGFSVFLPFSWEYRLAK
ncbi:MAG TPA: outer membrane beta-barrel domain-containing protein [Polyangiaceae bacterium]